MSRDPLVEAVARADADLRERQRKKDDAKMTEDVKAMLDELAGPPNRKTVLVSDADYGREAFPNSPGMTGHNAVARPWEAEQVTETPPPTGQVLYDKSPELYADPVAPDAPLVIRGKDTEPIAEVKGEDMYPRSPTMTGNNRSGWAALDAYKRNRELLNDPEVKYPSTNPPAEPLSWPAAPVRHGNKNR